MDKTKFICGFCNKGFTHNASLRRHKQNIHFNTKYNCISCQKVYTRQEDLIIHCKVCLNEKLEDAKEEIIIDLTQKARSTSTDMAMIASDLALSESETSITDTEIGIMGQHLNSILTKSGTCQPTLNQAACPPVINPHRQSP